MSYINYPTPTAEQAKIAQSEIEKYRHLVAPYCSGCGVDLGSQGVPVVPWAMSVDLPKDKFEKYCGGQPQKGPIHIRADITETLPFDTDSLDFVVVSHVAEDFPRSRWPDLFREWTRVLKPGGRFICLVPDEDRWWKYVERGGIHNQAHAQPQPRLGEMTQIATSIGLVVVEEKYADVYPGDYTLIMVAEKA